MDGNTYIALLKAIEHLQADLLAKVPEADKEQVNLEIADLYGMVNEYNFDIDIDNSHPMTPEQIERRNDIEDIFKED